MDGGDNMCYVDTCSANGSSIMKNNDSEFELMQPRAPFKSYHGVIIYLGESSSFKTHFLEI